MKIVPHLARKCDAALAVLAARMAAQSSTPPVLRKLWKIAVALASHANDVSSARTCSRTGVSAVPLLLK